MINDPLYWKWTTDCLFSLTLTGIQFKQKKIDRSRKLVATVYWLINYPTTWQLCVRSRVGWAFELSKVKFEGQAGLSHLKKDASSPDEPVLDFLFPLSELYVYSFFENIDRFKSIQLGKGLVHIYLFSMLTIWVKIKILKILRHI